MGDPVLFIRSSMRNRRRKSMKNSLVFRLWGLCRLAFDERLGLAHEDMSNDPIVPLFVQTGFANLGKTRFGELKALGQRDARLVGLVESVLRHGQRHVSLHRAVYVSVLAQN